jgi:sugar lactone lactonase YvrE
VNLELLAHGFKLVEAPRCDGKGSLFFTDIVAGGVYRLAPDRSVEVVVPDRKNVGGLALHEDGGFVMSGSEVVHWRAGESRTLLSVPGVNFWNDLHPDAKGRVVVGCIRGDVSDLRAPRQAGECWRIGEDGEAVELYGGVALSNGIGFSPDGSHLYHVDSTGRGFWVHRVGADGEVSGGGSWLHRPSAGASPTGCAST